MDASSERRIDDLGGRLRLLPVGEFDHGQAAIHARLLSWFARPDHAGYQAVLPDGRLLGPFNAFIRNPAVGGAHLDWAEAIASIGLPDAVREVAILTVGALWRTPYVLYAHSIVASTAGLGEADIGALRDARQEPAGLDPEASLAHRFTVALVRDHDVPDDLYREALETFGEAGTVALIALIGQYLTTSALLTCFRVPEPAN